MSQAYPSCPPGGEPRKTYLYSTKQKRAEQELAFNSRKKMTMKIECCVVAPTADGSAAFTSTVLTPAGSDDEEEDDQQALATVSEVPSAD